MRLALLFLAAALAFSGFVLARTPLSSFAAWLHRAATTLAHTRAQWRRSKRTKIISPLSTQPETIGMERTGRKVIYTEDLLNEFHPVWTKLANQPGFENDTLRLRDLMLWADDEAIMNGTSPLLPEIERHKSRVADFVAKAKPDWPENTVRNFRFYCLYHNDRELEFDFDDAARRALERKNRAFREQLSAERSRAPPQTDVGHD